MLFLIAKIFICAIFHAFSISVNQEPQNLWWCRSELEIGHAGIEHGYAPFVIQDSYDCILPFRHEGRLYYKCGVERAPGKFFCLVNDKNGHKNMHPCKPDQEIQWNRGVLTLTIVLF